MSVRINNSGSSGGGGAAQTPWTSDIDGAGYKLKNVLQIGVNTSSPVYPIDSVGLIHTIVYSAQSVSDASAVSAATDECGAGTYANGTVVDYLVYSYKISKDGVKFFSSGSQHAQITANCDLADLSIFVTIPSNADGVRILRSTDGIPTYTYYQDFPLNVGANHILDFGTGWTIGTTVTPTTPYTNLYGGLFEGYVGINNNNPAYPLDVNGIGNFTGNVIAPTFNSGTLSGNNSGDQDVSSFVVSGSDATLGNITVSSINGGSISGNNSGDQTDISGNAGTVTTNANLTGPVSSLGNTTTLTSQTGSGSKIVVDTGPTITNAFLSGSTNIGTVTTYNTIATVGNGVPVERALVNLATQSAAKTTTTIFTPSITAIYRISVYLQITRAASTSSILGGTSGVVITYNDGDGNVAQTDTVALQSAAGTVVTTVSTNTTATNLEGSKIIYAKSGVAVTYAIDYTSVGTTSMQYAAHLRMEEL